MASLYLFSIFVETILHCRVLRGVIDFLFVCHHTPSGCLLASAEEIHSSVWWFSGDFVSYDAVAIMESTLYTGIPNLIT